eukprot:4195639-Amphidinium_carterae.1
MGRLQYGVTQPSMMDLRPRLAQLPPSCEDSNEEDGWSPGDDALSIALDEVVFDSAIHLREAERPSRGNTSRRTYGMKRPSLTTSKLKTRKQGKTAFGRASCQSCQGWRITQMLWHIRWRCAS